MKIYVCVKQVPDTSGKVAVKENGVLDRASMKTIINPDDLNAVEAALQIKDQEGCEVIAVTMGPPAAESMLRELYAMGIDKAVLISGREFGGSDTFATSQVIAGGIHHLGLEKDDIIFCGRQAIDGDTAQVGPQIAEKLNIPQVTYAGEVKYENGKVFVKRMTEDGYMKVEVETPVLITCIKELNEPRYMTVRGILECFDRPITVLDYPTLENEPLIDKTTIGLAGSPTTIFQSFTPPVAKGGEMLEGTTQEKTDALAAKLAKAQLI
ncbi:MAG: electron transfer flavoprotein subunit beta/FixA family protein [Erysipelotrichaceae bacterium]|nr:electron transfer flavoprotein subunit beta/FixA family protein [Erysipelotrichaceae bacterium]MBR3168208.1 electron transfer flavoprotein subunit beta/FixA family protein [Erysipelotrichaceae bacterium]